jgi:protein SCO1
MSMLRSWAPALAVLAVLGCSHPRPPAFHASDITGSSLGTDFDLRDGSGRPRRLSDFRGQAVVVFFGYTRCPDVCPTTLATLAGAMRILGSAAKRVQVIFITLDPQRDTPARLSRYTSWFYPTFLGLRGDPAETAATAKAFNVFYQKHDDGSAMGYSIDHFAGSFAYDPAGRLRLLISEGETSAQVADDLKLLLAGK